MKRTYPLSLLIIASMLLLTCGNEPPEEFYTGTPEDSTAIAQLLDDNAHLLVSEDMFDSIYTFLDLAATEFLVADSFMRNDPTLVKQHVDSTALELTNRPYGLDYWFAKDTTCTVYLYDTFEVQSLMHADVKYTAYYDSMVIDPVTGDTNWRIKTVVIDSTPYDDSREITGNGYRHIYFDPVRDTVVDEETGETTYPVREPREWTLKRISYGIYNFPAAGTDIPIIDMLKFTYADGRVDSIIASSYDTLYTGYVMNRFRAVDSLLVIDLSNLDQDSLGYHLDVRLTLGFGTVTVDMCSFYASCNGADRIEMTGTANPIVGELILPSDISTGSATLYFEAVVDDHYYYVSTPKDYKAQVWRIPVNITGG